MNSMGSGRAIIPGNSSELLQQYNPVPWDFMFDLSVYVRNIEDGTQIFEQIAPIFRPDYTLSINFDNTMGNTIDIPIILNSVQYTVDDEGDFSTMRLLIWDLTFTVKGWLFSQRQQTPVIRKANVNIYSTDTISRDTVFALVMNSGGFGSYQAGEFIYQGPNLPV